MAFFGFDGISGVSRNRPAPPNPNAPRDSPDAPSGASLLGVGNELRLVKAGAAGAAQYLASMAFNGDVTYGSLNVFGTRVQYSVGSGLIVFASSLANSFIIEQLAPTIMANVSPQNIAVAMTTADAVGTGLLTSASLNYLGGSPSMLNAALQGGAASLAGQPIAAVVGSKLLL